MTTASTPSLSPLLVFLVRPLFNAQCLVHPNPPRLAHFYSVACFAISQPWQFKPLAVPAPLATHSHIYRYSRADAQR